MSDKAIVEKEAEKKRLKAAEKEKKQRLKAKKEAIAIRISEAKATELEAKLLKAKEKAAAAAPNTLGQFGTVAEPRKALSTYLRNQNKLEVSTVAILDRKAAILIRICTTLLSATIAFEVQLVANVSNGHLIAHTLIAGLMISLIAALLGTKPDGGLINRIFKKTYKNDSKPEESVYMRASRFTIEEYEEAMSKVVKSQDLQIGNQVRGNYLLSTNNVYKARLIDFSYTAFLLTFIVVAVINLSTKFLH